MKRIYVIGCHSEEDKAKIREEIESTLNDKAEIIFVGSRENINIKDRFSSDSDSVILESISFKNIKRDVDEPHTFFDRKRKGYERPYKFHK